MNSVLPPLRLLQLTDLHLFAKPEKRLLGITTRSSFEATLAFALRRTKQARALVITGDLVHDETAEGYRYLGDRLDRSGIPYYCLPGNHDRRDLMDQWLGAAAAGPFSVRRLDGWRLVFLDSSKPGRDTGTLADEQLEALRGQLRADAAPTLIFLHHHPIAVGSAWMDTMRVENGAELIDLCARFKQVKGILFGHVHQEFASAQGELQILGTPATCFQFHPGSANFALDDHHPGYRELMLYPDGRLTSSVTRLETYPESPESDAHGY